MPSERQLTLSFEDTEDYDVAKANKFATELAERLRDTDETIVVQQTRSNPSVQDFGSTLVLLLATPSIAAFAKGVAGWLAMRPEAKVTIKDKNGTLIASGLTSADARTVIEQQLGRAD